MYDPRHTELSRLLVEHSCKLQKGEACLIETTDVPPELLKALVQEVYRAGAYPVLALHHDSLEKEIINGATRESLAVIRDIEKYRMEKMDAFIGIRAPENPREHADLKEGRQQLYNSMVMTPVHHNIRVRKTKWVVLRYPTNAMALLAGMSNAGFEEFYYRVTLGVDYKKMREAMVPAVEFLTQADQVKIKGPGTDLTFSIKGMGVVTCSGDRNIPDGEIYTAPLKESVNGSIYYNSPSTYQGFTFNEVRFTIKKGKIIEAVANDSERIHKVLDADEGARFFGEFAMGCNPFITFPMDNILFDEKIGGSFHFTPGMAYDEADNGNRSTVHWDLVSIQTKEYGGGTIEIDGEIIRQDGVFLHPAFTGLNPENLMSK